MNRKLILTDLDLTLLHSDATISERTAATLRKCQEAGHLVGFSTSRGATRIQKYVEQIKPDIVICNAGASIFYNGKLLHEETFTLEETHTLMDAVYAVFGDDAEITVDTLTDFYWNRENNKSTQYGNDAKYDDCRNFPCPAMKFCVQTEDGDKAQQVASKVANCDCIQFSDIPWFKFSPKSATKENGISYLSDYLKISTEDMISFGDDFSDIGMLKICGIGVAMENAIPQVKECTEHHTLSCDEDGVAVWLEKNLLA